ncbi:hypothetical protein MQC88_01405 [Luteimonas sp. 50]|uniref:Uncharacterized protein n=1 Tax=Cognatiluteimonas sedimenti TaxID=2927791 RepID=A0ABT0A0X2_9GAMM|nr:hypothetical protein [Lysobacter sedimenti]MCJ0824629.1 hypothetical protein [Lysobacter sedimenti]
MAAQLLQGEGFKVQVEPQAGYLRAHVFDGTDSLQVSIAMWKLLGEQCRLFRAGRLLVLEDLADTVELAEIDSIVRAMAGFGFAGIRIAFVELRDDVSGNEHAEILAADHGIRVMVFSNEDAARRWLLYGVD